MKVLRIVPNMASDTSRRVVTSTSPCSTWWSASSRAPWYMQLMAPEDRSLNVGFLEPGHSFFAGHPSGAGHYAMVLTVQVDDVDEAIFQRPAARRRDSPGITGRGVRAAAFPCARPERIAAQRNEHDLM